MKNKEIEELLNKMKTILKTYKELKVEPTLCEELITTGELNLLLSYIEQLEKENQQLKKQKDDVVELIKKQLLSNTNITKYTDEMCLKDLLRMLGDSDV